MVRRLVSLLAVVVGLLAVDEAVVSVLDEPLMPVDGVVELVVELLVDGVLALVVAEPVVDRFID